MGLSAKFSKTVDHTPEDVRTINYKPRESFKF